MNLANHATPSTEMQETHFALSTPDGYLIYGVLNRLSTTEKLLIFVHGLTGEKENHLYYNGARFFPMQGFDTYRFDLFSNEVKGRKLHDCSILTFSGDLNTVIDHFSDQYREIHVVGHSIGGCVAMNAKQENLSSLILWDTGLNHHGATPEVFEPQPDSGLYLAKLKIHYFLSAELISQRAQQNGVVVKKVQVPIKLIFAGATRVQDSWQPNLQHIKPYYESMVIDGAGHGFNEFGKNDILFYETLTWLQSARGAT